MSFRSLALALPFTVVLASAAACGDDGSSGATTGGAGGDDANCGGGITPVVNSEFCQQGATLNCALLTPAATNQLCNVALPQPAAELTRATDTDEFSGQGAPNVSCYAPASYPPAPPASSAASLVGHVRVFSNGNDTANVTIEVYDVQPTGELGARIGNAVVTPDSCTATGEASDCEDCPDETRYECDYVYEGVPTETPLAVKTSGSSWQSLIAYNIYVPTSDLVDGGYEYDPRALATDDYGVIAQAAIGGPITTGNGAIAGEVHDCDNVRVLNAVADVNVNKKALVYFTSNEDDPLPEAGALGTSRLGLYAALDVPSGPAVVAAAGLVNGQVVALGEHKVWVYPDTVTSLTFRGLRPTQVPAAQ